MRVTMGVSVIFRLTKALAIKRHRHPRAFAPNLAATSAVAATTPRKHTNPLIVFRHTKTRFSLMPRRMAMLSRVSANNKSLR